MSAVPWAWVTSRSYPIREDVEAVSREEWRVIGEPGDGYAPYNFTFDSEQRARDFVRLVTGVLEREPWDDGPHIERRTVAETPWERAES